MANPNLINTSSCFGNFINFQNVAAQSSGGTTLLSGSSLTDKLRKVVLITFCNTTSSVRTIRLYESSTSGSGYILYDVDLPAKATLVAIDRETPLYMPEGSRSLLAAADSTGVDVTIVYEEYDDA